MLRGYSVRPDGVLQQVDYNGPRRTYDREYVRRYDAYPHREMSQLRLSLIRDLPEPPASVLDWGYGNGSFLRACGEAGLRARGYDITGCPPPAGAEFSDELESETDLVTFFDSLEHLPDIDAVASRLRSRWVVISVPWCHWPEEEAWLRRWKHLRPDEHRWHFNDRSLARFMAAHGYLTWSLAAPEDLIRGPSGPRSPNILTGVFYAARPTG